MQPSRQMPTQAIARNPEWKLLADSSVVAVALVSRSGELRWCNETFSNLLHVPSPTELAGRSITDFFEQAKDWAVLARVEPGAPRRRIKLRLKTAEDASLVLKGDVIGIDAQENEGAVLLMLGDGTELEQLRLAVQRSARLEALGSLTSGVAHDFNNLLTVLVGNLALIAEELREQPERFAKLKAARDAATRGADLIRQLLAFARQEPVESDLINPAKVIAKIVPLIDRALGSKVTLELELDENAGSVLGNSAQLESVIVNLAVNARDAIDLGGTVRIVVGMVQVDAETAARVGLEPGAFLRIEVADDGGGIPAEVIERVFEPFFSTKTDRGGTGLGLSMVKSYATQFSGAATIESAPGQGTAVRLLFPRAADTLDDSIAMTMPLSTLPTGDESVLLVAADDGIQAMVSQILSVLGYDVRTAEGLGEANLMMRERMPGLLISDGFDPAALINALSGDAASASACRTLRLLTGSEASDLDDAKRSQLLFKPFSLADLAGAVRDALDAEIATD